MRLDQKKSITTITKDGEIIINLNLNINLDGKDINILRDNINNDIKFEDKKEENKPEFIPDEMFGGDNIPSIKGFGKKVK